MCAPNLIRIIKANKPMLRNRKKNAIDMDLWKSINIFVIFSDSISGILPDTLNLFKLPEHLFIIRMCHSNFPTLDGIKNYLYENKVPLILLPPKKAEFFKIGSFGELIFYSESVDKIKVALANWLDAEYFDIAIISQEKLNEIKQLFLNDAQKYSYDILYNVVLLSYCFLRKSGDDEEMEILTLHMTFDDIKAAIDRLQVY